MPLRCIAWLSHQSGCDRDRASVGEDCVHVGDRQYTSSRWGVSGKHRRDAVTEWTDTLNPRERKTTPGRRTETGRLGLRTQDTKSFRIAHQFWLKTRCPCAIRRALKSRTVQWATSDNDRVHRAAANDFQLQKPAWPAAPVRRIVMLLLFTRGYISQCLGSP